MVSTLLTVPTKAMFGGGGRGIRGELTSGEYEEEHLVRSSASATDIRLVGLLVALLVGGLVGFILVRLVGWLVG